MELSQRRLLTAARKNLGLAHAMGGDVAHASEAFAQAGDRATEATTSKLKTRSDDC
jgi:hypothetical protein